jgi:hypothetical protein
MHNLFTKTPGGHQPWRRLSVLLLFLFLVTVIGAASGSQPAVLAQDDGDSVRFAEGIDPEQWYRDHEIENSWTTDYLDLATGDPSLLSEHGVYEWPFALDSIGWSMQSYQDYGGMPYFHHGMDMMKMWGTQVFNRSGGQVINIENYQYNWDLYWEVAVLDPDGYIWQYHHIQMETIPQYIWDKFAEWEADPVNGGFIPPDTHIGNIIEWPVWSYGKQFNHIHLNIIAEDGFYVNGFEFHVDLPDTVGPEIQGVGLLQNGQIYDDNIIEGDYSLYIQARDLILDNVYYLPPWEITFSVDGGPVHTTWRFDRLPGPDRYAYLNDFYVVPPTCGNYDCREYYIDLGFIPDSQFTFPFTGGEHTILVAVRDYAGNEASQSYTYTVIGPPPGTPIWQDDFETDKGWVVDPDENDTATSGQWERGDPEATYSNGPKQLDETTSGVNDLVTGRLAEGGANNNDVDAGVTSIRSPEITLPAANNLTLSFWSYFAHGSNATNADYLRVTVVGSSTAMVFEELGAPENDDAAWAINNVSLDAFAGDTVYVLITAADDAGDSLVEAAVDNVMIMVNQTPTAHPQSVETQEDTQLDITLSGSDPDGDWLTYIVVMSPTHGTLSGTAPDLTYIPSENFNGSDSFSFTVSDGQISSEPAEVNIDITPVNDAPVADSQSVMTTASTPVAVTLSGSDIDGDEITFSVLSGPEHGMLSGAAPNLVYTPAVGYTAEDSFSFIVNDGELDSAEAVVSITINGYVVYGPVVFR